VIAKIYKIFTLQMKLLQSAIRACISKKYGVLCYFEEKRHSNYEDAAPRIMVELNTVLMNSGHQFNRERVVLAEFRKTLHQQVLENTAKYQTNKQN